MRRLGLALLLGPAEPSGGQSGGGCGATGLEAAALLGVGSLLRRRRC